MTKTLRKLETEENLLNLKKSNYKTFSKHHFPAAISYAQFYLTM